jgi:hypothetical protein
MAVATWLGDDTDLTVNQVTVSEPDVDVILLGPSQHRPIEELEGALTDALGYRVVVTVTQIPASEESYSEEEGKTTTGLSTP